MGELTKYEKVRFADDASSDSEGGDVYTEPARLPTRWTTFVHHNMAYLIALNTALFFVSISILFFVSHIEPLDADKFVAAFSSYSPARSAVRYISGTFNATQGIDSPYVGSSNITDEMWNYVTSDIGDQMITVEELRTLGKPETSIRVKDPKSGKEGYRIGIEVFHQLHCLNLIRKSTFGDLFKGQGDLAEDEGKVRTHIDHCLEMLRMNIMCQVDIGVITFHELPGKTGDPYPDFSTKHVCRDFDAVRDWAIENTVANDDVF